MDGHERAVMPGIGWLIGTWTDADRKLTGASGLRHALGNTELLCAYTCALLRFLNVPYDLECVYAMCVMCETLVYVLCDVRQHAKRRALTHTRTCVAPAQHNAKATRQHR